MEFEPENGPRTLGLENGYLVDSGPRSMIEIRALNKGDSNNPPSSLRQMAAVAGRPVDPLTMSEFASARMFSTHSAFEANADDFGAEMEELKTIRTLRMDEEQLKMLQNDADRLWLDDDEHQATSSVFAGSALLDSQADVRDRARSVPIDAAGPRPFAPNQADNLEFTTPPSVTSRFFNTLRPQSTPVAGLRGKTKQNSRSGSSASKILLTREVTEPSLHRSTTSETGQTELRGEQEERAPASMKFLDGQFNFRSISGTSSVGRTALRSRANSKGSSASKVEKEAPGSFGGRSRLWRRKEIVAFRSASVTVPKIEFTEHEIDDWATELFALHHNTLRREMVDLFKILKKMEKCLLTLNDDDLEAFFVWWGCFANVTREVFAVREAVLFPWLENVLPLEGTLTRDVRRSKQALILQVMHVIDSLKEDMIQTKKSNGFVRLVLYCEKLCSALLSYMSAMEDEVPSKLEMFFTLDGKLEVDVKVRDWMWKRKHGHLFFASVYRWVYNTPLWADWKELHLKGPRKILVSRWYKHYERTHVKHLEHFENLK
mmetsp:Transcript_6245/g.11119  ORF Transcript_6245/g.11119 Transcript_6245/m.11119 type:complete len:546 (-) Transcript_6245:440-2077(-)